MQINYRNPWVIGGAAACGVAATVAAVAYYVYKAPGQLVEKAVEDLTAPVAEAAAPIVEKVTETVAEVVATVAEPAIASVGNQLQNAMLGLSALVLFGAATFGLQSRFSSKAEPSLPQPPVNGGPSAPPQDQQPLGSVSGANGELQMPLNLSVQPEHPQQDPQSPAFPQHLLDLANGAPAGLPQDQQPLELRPSVRSPQDPSPQVVEPPHPSSRNRSALPFSLSMFRQNGLAVSAQYYRGRSREATEVPHRSGAAYRRTFTQDDSNLISSALVRERFNPDHSSRHPAIEAPSSPHSGWSAEL